MELNLVVQVFLGLGLAIIMFGIGLTLEGADFIRIFQMPKAVLAGLTGQLLGLPLAAILAIALFQLPPEYAMGLLIIATSPGGPTSNLFSFLAQADVALSVTLTAFSSTLTLVTIPLILGVAADVVLGESSQIRVPAGQIMLQLLLLVLLPMGAGILVRKHRKDWAQRWHRTTATFSLLILAAIIAYVLFEDFSGIRRYMSELFPSLLVFFLLAFGLGIGVSRLAQVKWKQTKTISIEIGIQNGAQAMVIATGALGFNSAEMGVPAALYSISMYLFVALLFLSFRMLDRSRH